MLLLYDILKRIQALFDIKTTFLNLKVLVTFLLIVALCQESTIAII